MKIGGHVIGIRGDSGRLTDAAATDLHAPKRTFADRAAGRFCAAASLGFGQPRLTHAVSAVSHCARNFGFFDERAIDHPSDLEVGIERETGVRTTRASFSKPRWANDRELAGVAPDQATAAGFSVATRQ
jgi:hypothetical protein